MRALNADPSSSQRLCLNTEFSKQHTVRSFFLNTDTLGTGHQASAAHLQPPDAGSSSSLSFRSAVIAISPALLYQSADVFKRLKKRKNTELEWSDPDVAVVWTDKLLMVLL
ncbi:hypothetical protein AOLI_G00136950 [Acnodon oligacanthus]